jgi:predicted nucleotidyltransferase
MNLINQHINQISLLCRKHKVKELYAFGSVLDEKKFNKESDVDLLVDFENVPLLEYADNFFDLADELESVLKRKVDLLTIKSLTNKYFIENVNSTKKIVYKA